MAAIPLTVAVSPLKKYATFSGRSHRKEYLLFVLFVVVVFIALTIVDDLLGTYDAETGWGLLSGLFSLATLVPYLALNSRRLHDIGKSGWLQLLFLIPLVGLILWIVWMASEGDLGVNKYGPDPRLPDGSSPCGALLA